MSTPPDVAGLSPPLASVVSRIVAARPACAVQLVLESSPDLDRFARLRSPTGDSASDLVLWDEQPTRGLGLGFRAWHTHPDGAGWTRSADDELSSFVAVAVAIIDGELVGLSDPGRDGFEPIVDLCDPSGLMEELTRPDSTGRGRIHTWSGAGDREISVSDLGG